MAVQRGHQRAPPNCRRSIDFDSPNRQSDWCPVSSEKTLAIVLRVVDFSETSVVLSLFTETYGKINALAKGARRPKSAFYGAIDILSLSQVIFLPRRSGTLDLLTEAKLARRFRPCQWSLARLYAGYYLAELLTDLTEPHQALPELFQLAVATMADLQTRETAFAYQPVPAILLRFEMRALALLGHGLGLTHCAGCDTPLIGEVLSATDSIEHLSNRRNGKLFFSLTDTSLVCRDCCHERGRLLGFSQRAAQVLRIYQDENDSAWRQYSEWGSHPVFRQMMDYQWAAILNRPLHLTPAIRQLAKKERQTTQK
jgi:DNA repair protein RecO